MWSFVVPSKLNIAVDNRRQVPTVGGLFVKRCEIEANATTCNYPIGRTCAREAPDNLTDRPRFVLDLSTIDVLILILRMAERSARRWVSKMSMRIYHLRMQARTKDRDPKAAQGKPFTHYTSGSHKKTPKKLLDSNSQ